MTGNTTRSCVNCPNYLTSTQAAKVYRKNIGAPVCAKYGHVLGRPPLNGDNSIVSAHNTAIARHMAKDCPSFGRELDSAPRPVPQLSVAFPSPAPDHHSSPSSMPGNEPRTCAACRHFVPAAEIQQSFGWTSPMCRAKGRLLFSNQLTYEAEICKIGAYGIRPPHRADDIKLLPIFQDSFVDETMSVVRNFFDFKNNFVEPHEYPSDKPVTDEDTKHGIRAWRKVDDPEGTGKFSHLPIFDPNFFDEIERSKIPRTGDDEHPELYVDHFGGVYLAAIVWMELDETPALWGQAGVGKTELFRHLAWLMCLPFERLSITATTELDDLIGKTLYSPDRGTYFEYGRLPKAWAKPCVVVLDEPNTGPPEVWQALRPLTDNSKQLVIDTNKGERIARNENAFPGFAMNPAWDPLNVGTQEIGDADASRLFHVYIGMPPETLEREIIQARVKLDGWELSTSQLDMVMRIAKDVRSLVESSSLPFTWGIRPQIKVARALRWFDTVTAYRVAIGNFLEPEALDKLLDQVRAHSPGE